MIIAYITMALAHLFCHGASTTRQQSDLFGLRVNLSPVAVTISLQPLRGYR